MQRDLLWLMSRPDFNIHSFVLKKVDSSNRITPKKCFMMKHYEEDEWSATSRYVFMIIRIPCGMHMRLDDYMGHIAFEKLV